MTVNIEIQRQSRLDVACVTLRNGELYLQRRNTGQFADYCRRRGIGTHTDLTQTDDSVKRSHQFGLLDLSLYGINLSLQGGIFCFHLFVSLLAHRIFLQQGALAVHTVHSQLLLSLKTLQLGLQLAVVHLCQQLSFCHMGSFLEINGNHLS